MLGIKILGVGSRVTCAGKVGTVISVKKAKQLGATKDKSRMTDRGVQFDDGSVAIVNVNSLNAYKGDKNA